TTDAWDKLKGVGVRISGGNGTPWIVNAAHNIFRWIAPIQNWEQIARNAMDVGVGCNGHVWVTSAEPETQNRALLYWDDTDHSNPSGDRWHRVEGVPRPHTIDVDPDGLPWVVSLDG